MADPYALTNDELQAYRDQGFVIKKAVFTPAECDAFVQHMMDLHAGKEHLAGYPPRAHDEWGRTHNQHIYDPKALDLLLHPRLRQALAQCLDGPADGIQTMYFYIGSTQRRHQDAYYLPECMSAWIALTDVGPENGTIWVQPGSQRGRLITKQDFGITTENPIHVGEKYNDAVDSLFIENAQKGLPEFPVLAAKGDVVYFHGHLIHRGGPIGKPGSFRHVMANHYIPHAATTWPYADWPRYDFDRQVRYNN